jgi:hypothetical protein
MSVEWKLTCADTSIDDTLADLDITSAVLSLESQGVDRLTLTQEPDAGFIGTALIPYNSICRLVRDGVTFFTGRRRLLPRIASMPQEEIRYEIAGPWFDLERITYGQRWQIWDTVTEAPTWQYKSRLILGQAENGTAMSIGAIIADVITYAASKGALLALPASTAAWPAMKLPWEEITNLKCADVINRLLAFVPDYKVHIDYSEETPVFNLVARSAAATVTGAIGTTDISEISIVERSDMAPPGVRVRFERTHSVGGSSYESTEVQEAGDPDHMDALEITLPLAGANLQTQSARVVSEALPVAGAPEATDFLHKPWWKEQVPALAEYADADLTLIECTPTVEDPPDGGDTPAIWDLPRVLVDGSIPKWLTGDVYTARATLALKYSYIERRVEDGKKVTEVKEATISHSLVLTSVPTGTYSRTSGDFAEPAPDGFAAALYASWSQLQYEGNIGLDLVDVTDYAHPGAKLNLTGGLSAWTTMAAHIQQVQYEIETGRVALVIGPAKRVDPANLLSLMRRLRARALPINHLARTSGNPADRGGNVQGGDIGPEKNTVATGGRHTYLNVSPDYDEAAPYVKEIELDATAITKTNGADTDPVTVKAREVSLAVMDGDTTGKVIRAQILSSAPYDQPGATSTPAKDGFLLVPKPAGSNPGVLVYNPASGVAWLYATSDNTPFLQRASGVMAFDEVRFI